MEIVIEGRTLEILETRIIVEIYKKCKKYHECENCIFSNGREDDCKCMLNNPKATWVMEVEE